MTTKDIAKLITDNPDLDICFFGSDEGMCYEYSTTLLTSVSAFIDCPLAGAKFPPLDDCRCYLLDRDKDEIIDRYAEVKWDSQEEIPHTQKAMDALEEQLEKEGKNFWESLPREPQIIIVATA